MSQLPDLTAFPVFFNPPSSLTASICENSRTFFPLNMIHWFPKQILLHSWKMHFLCTFNTFFNCPKTAKPWISISGQWSKNYFLCKFRFESYIKDSKVESQVKFRSASFKVCLVLIFLNTIVEKTYPEPWNDPVVSFSCSKSPV